MCPDHPGLPDGRDWSDRPVVEPSCPFTVERPTMTQRWERLTFVHWPVDPEAVGRLLPPETRRRHLRRPGLGEPGALLHARRDARRARRALGVPLLRDECPDLRRGPAGPARDLVLLPGGRPARRGAGGAQRLPPAVPLGLDDAHRDRRAVRGGPMSMSEDVCTADQGVGTCVQRSSEQRDVAKSPALRSASTVIVRAAGVAGWPRARWSSAGS